MENSPSERLRKLRKAKGFKRPEDAAERHGWSKDTYKAHESGARGITPKKAKEYAKAFGSTPEYILFQSGNLRENKISMTQPTLENSSINAQNMHDDIPLYGPLEGDPSKIIRLVENHVIGTEHRPEELERVKGGYMAVVPHKKMEPRFKEGEKISVHPFQKPLPTEECVIVLEPDARIMIKEFVGEDDVEIRVRQLNPPHMHRILKKDIRSLHAIVGWRRR